MPQGHCCKLSRITPSWRKKDCHVFLVTRDFTHIFLATTFYSSPTTSLYLHSSMSIAQHHLRCQLTFARGHSFVSLWVYTQVQRYAFCRLPRRVVPAASNPPPVKIMLLEHTSESPVIAQYIQVGTSKDPLLSTFFWYILNGWLSSNPAGSELSPYFSRRTQLLLQDGCILWGSCIVVPPQERKMVLEDEAHPGMS